MNMMLRHSIALIGAALIAVASGDVVAAQSDCKMVRLAEWQVQTKRNALVVDGSINQRKVGVMLDTGAGNTQILRSTAIQLGLTRQSIGSFRQFGVGGETDVEVATVEELKIGESSRRNWQMFVAGENDLGGDVGVILGEDFFRKVDVEFDLAHNMVRLYQPKDCEGASLAYWTKEGASVVDMARLDEARPQIVLTVLINGRRVQALLDSGASTSVLDRYEAAQAGITPETPGVVPAGPAFGLGKKGVDSWVAPIQTFTIGDEMIRDTTLHFADLFKDATYLPGGSRIPRKVDELQPMLLGADFLRSHRVLVSHSQRKIYFSYVGGPVFRTARTGEPRGAPPDARRSSTPQFDFKP
jgi:predicted aspartyl protease